MMTSLHCKARVGEDGSLSIPCEALKELGVKPGDELSVSVFPTPAPEENGADTKGRMITFGMFPAPGAFNEEDFKSAEFHGDPDDGLDWENEANRQQADYIKVN